MKKSHKLITYPALPRLPSSFNLSQTWQGRQETIEFTIKNHGWHWTQGNRKTAFLTYETWSRTQTFQVYVLRTNLIYFNNACKNKSWILPITVYFQLLLGWWSLYPKGRIHVEYWCCWWDWEWFHITNHTCANIARTTYKRLLKLVDKNHNII